MLRRPAPLPVLLALLAGCGEPAEPEGRDPAQLLAEATARQFGDGFDPAAPVAHVDGQAIRVGDLALCRERAPAWTLRQCLDDLVEVAVLSRRASDADRSHPRLADARQAALASALLREAVDVPLASSALSDAEVQAFQAERNNWFYFGRPHLRQTSHLLVQGPAGASPEARALAERIYRETAWPEVASAADLDRARSTWRAEAQSAGLELLVERHFLAQADNSLERAWGGVPLLAQPFADGLFALPGPGAVSPPVDTDYGTHLILFERDFPAVALAPAEAAALARHELGQRRRADALNRLRDELLERADVVRHETADVFRMSDEQLIRERNATLREQLGPQGP